VNNIQLEASGHSGSFHDTLIPGTRADGSIIDQQL